MNFENSEFYTNRLKIRPSNTSDYNSWYLGFSKRQKSKYKSVKIKFAFLILHIFAYLFHFEKESIKVLLLTYISL